MAPPTKDAGNGYNHSYNFEENTGVFRRTANQGREREEERRDMLHGNAGKTRRKWRFSECDYLGLRDIDLRHMSAFVEGLRRS
jgi:hypothetical protein